MSLRQQQDLLARLYTDPMFRREFLAEPAKYGVENGLTSAELAELAAIVPEELEFFAETLFWKRLREAEKMLPLTKKWLGERFSPLFREFSEGYTPRSIKKHLEDAVAFCRFLKKSDVVDLVKDIAEYERARLVFFGYGKRLTVGRLRFDFRKLHLNEVTPEFAENIPRRITTAIWIRQGRKTRHFFI